MMKKIILFLALVLFIFMTSPVQAGKKSPVPTPIPVPIPKSICIDAGHGGTEIGTSNLDLLEKNVNLEVAILLRDKLINEAGYIKDETLFMTRETDVTMTNADRYNFCNAKNTAILISIHHNGSIYPTVDYSLGLYMKEVDIPLAREVVNTISKSLDLTNKDITRFASGVLLKSNMPSTISEGFFLTSAFEYPLVKSGVRQQQEVQALFTAINNYFN